MKLLLGDPPVNQRNAKLRRVEVSDVLATIRRDAGLKKSTLMVRREEDHSEKKRLKSTLLPYVLPFNYGELTRNSRNFRSAEMMMFEADGVADLRGAMEKARAHPCSHLAYVSVSGEGFKVLMKLDQEVGREHYVRLYNFFRSYIGQELGVQFDPSSKDMARVQYLSHDPAAHYAAKSRPLRAGDILRRLEMIDDAPQGRAHEDELEYDAKDIRRAIAHARKHGYLDEKDEKTWWELSMSLASLGEGGREFFLELSRDHPLYPEDTEERLGDRYAQLARSWGHYHDEERVLNMNSFFSIMEKKFKFKSPRAKLDGRKNLELVLADKFTEKYRNRLLYDHSKSGKAKTYGWYIWDGARFALSKKGEISDYYLRFIEEEKKLAVEEAKRRREEKDAAPEGEGAPAAGADEPGRIMNLASVSRAESRRLRDLTLTWAGEREGLGVLPDDLDHDPDLLCVLNGVVNLRTGKLIGHDPAHRMTKLAPALHQRGAKCPNWEDFVAKICFGSSEIARYMQEAVGYSLTGHTSEQCLFFLYGIGANGKSTFLEGLRHIFGDYQVHANYETFTSLSRDGSSHSEDVVRLKGSRLVISTEINAQKSLNESVIKQITSGDVITARDLHSSSIEFRPTFKLWISGNHKPKIQNFDHGIKRRIFIVPFEYTFTEAEIRPQAEVLEEFKAEASGVLNWALEGARRWYERKRLDVPAAVMETTRQYFLESNVIEQFLSERCLVFDKDDRKTHNLRVETKELYQAYCRHVEGTNEDKVGRNQFYQRLEELGYKREVSREMRLIFKGIALRDPQARRDALTKDVPTN